ncbi:Homeodomain-like protein, partial [Schizophyllum commune]
IHPEQKKVIPAMYARGQKPRQIAASLPFSRRTVDRVLSTYKATGDVTRKPLVTGRPRVLTAMQLNYLEGLIERKPDIYLAELRQHLLEAFDVAVDPRTISRVL